MNTMQSLWLDVLSDPFVIATFLIVLALVTAILLVLMVTAIRLGTQIQHLATPIYDKTVKEAEKVAEHILAEARQQGSAIRAKAQADVDTSFANDKVEDEKFRLAQAAHLEDITAHAKTLLQEQVTSISQISQTVTVELQRQAQSAEKVISESSEAIRTSLAEGDVRLKNLFSTIESDMKKEYQGLVAQTKKRVADELSKEIDASREAVAAYRQEQFARVDLEIVRLVEDTARLAFGKALTLDTHRDIVLAALAEAKQQGVFTTST